MADSSEFDILFGLGYNLSEVCILSLVPASDFLFLGIYFPLNTWRIINDAANLCNSLCVGYLFFFFGGIKPCLALIAVGFVLCCPIIQFP